MVFGIAIYQNFIDITNYGNIYAVANKSGTKKGAHAQAIIGFDDNKDTPDGKGAFKVVNSWGTSWGDQGFYWISYKAMKANGLTEETKVWYVDDRNNYSSSSKVKFKVSSTDARQNSLWLSFGESKKYFIDFTYFSATSIERLSFPDSYIVLDVKDWDISNQNASSLVFSMKSKSTSLQSTIQSFIYVDQLTGINYSSNDTPVTVSYNGGSASISSDSTTSTDGSTDTGTDTGSSTDGNICSAEIMNMASSMGFQMFEMFSWIPFFGDMMNTAAGMFFNQVLESPSLTVAMIRCAKGNPALVSTMIKVVSANPSLLAKMGNIMQVSALFTEEFTDLAVKNSSLANFFFDVINDSLYRSMTMPMTGSVVATENISKLMKTYGKNEMQPNSPFAKVFFNLGGTSSSTDDNETANERFFYSMFRHIPAANNFLDTLSTLDSNMQQALLNFVFLGQQQTQTGAVMEHTSQKYLNNYAIIKAFMKGIAPVYDTSQMPNPESANPANALFGRFMPMLMQGEGSAMQPTAYGIAFFQSLMACAGQGDLAPARE